MIEVKDQLNTMRTKAFPVLTLFMLALLIPASSSSNSAEITPTDDPSLLKNDTTISAEAPYSVNSSSIITSPSEEDSTASTRPSVTALHILKTSKLLLSSPLPNNTTASAEDLYSVDTSSNTTPVRKEVSTASNLPSSVTSPDVSKTSKRHTSTSATRQDTTASPTKHSQGWLILILLVIVVLAVVVGCLHEIKNQQPGQEGAVTRFLLGVRDRLRTRIGNLEDRMGVRLWPGGKTGEEEDVEEADGGQTEEAGQQRDGEGEGGSNETSNENKEKDQEEDSETSDESSSEEDEGPKETVLNRQEEEEKNQSKAEDEDDDTSSGSDEDQSAAEGDSGGDKKADSEEIALMNYPQEDDENIDLCDVTVL